MSLGEVGLRTRGNTTRVRPENPLGTFHSSHFALKFNETFDLEAGSKDFEKRRDRRLFNLRGLNLKLNANPEDPSGYVREAYCYQMMNQVGVPAPRTGFALLELKILETDGKITPLDLGLYTLIEPVDKSFLTRRWGKNENDGNLYKALWQQGGPAALTADARWEKKDDLETPWFDPSPLWGVEHWETNYRPSYDLTTNEEKPDFTDLKAFITPLNTLQGPAFKSWMDTHFDVPRFLTWMAVNWLLGMPDDYRAMGNNYYLYFPRVEGPGSFIPYDYDNALGEGFQPYDTSNIGLFGVPTSPDFQDTPFGSLRERPLVDKILAIPEFRAGYIAEVKRLSRDPKIFSYQSFLSLYNQVKTSSKGVSVRGLGQTGVLPENPGNEEYFHTRLKSLQSELNPPPQVQVKVSMNTSTGEGFSTAYGQTVLSFTGKKDETRTFSIAANITAGNPAQVRFTLTTEKGVVIGEPIIDREAPFTAIFTKTKTPRYLDPPRISRLKVLAVALDSLGVEIGKASPLLVPEVLQRDYQSFTDNGDGTFTFRYRPSDDGLIPASDGKVYVRGDLTGLPELWLSMVPMEGPDAQGIYFLRLAASSKQTYKFFVDNGDPAFPETWWAGSWISDDQNPHIQWTGDGNSILP